MRLPYKGNIPHIKIIKIEDRLGKLGSKYSSASFGSICEIDKILHKERCINAQDCTSSHNQRDYFAHSVRQLAQITAEGFAQPNADTSTDKAAH